MTRRTSQTETWDRRERARVRQRAQEAAFLLVFVTVAGVIVGMALAWRGASPVPDALHTVPWRQNEAVRYLTPGQSVLYRNLMRWFVTLVFTVGPLVLAWITEPSLRALGPAAEKDLRRGHSPFRPLRAGLTLGAGGLIGVLMAAGGSTGKGPGAMTMALSGWGFVLIPAALTAVGLARLWREGGRAGATGEFAAFRAAFARLRRTLYTLLLLAAGGGLVLGYPLLLLTMFVTIAPTLLFFRKTSVEKSFAVERS